MIGEFNSDLQAEIYLTHVCLDAFVSHIYICMYIGVCVGLCVEMKNHKFLRGGFY